MPVEFIGIARTADRSETIAETGPAVQPDYLYHLAVTHEQSGFDRVLVAHSSSSPDGFTVADQVLNATSRLGVLLAHRPGFVAPTIAARKFATIDAFHPGRIALHVITGGDDADQARDGDFTDKATRYRRTDEFLDVVELEWSSDRAFQLRRRVLPGRRRLVGAAAAWRPPADLLRRCLRRRRPGRRQARGRLRLLGRAAGGHPPAHRPGARVRRGRAAAASTGSRSACARSPPTPRRPPGNGPARSSS